MTEVSASPLSESGSLYAPSEQSSSARSQSISSELSTSPDPVSSTASLSTASSGGQKIKSILNNPEDTLPRKSTRARSDSGFKAALKSTFLPPPVPGRQIKVKDGKTLGKSYRRCNPLPEAFEGGEVLAYDPRGEEASAGDGVIPPECLISIERQRARQGSFGDSSYNSDLTSDTGDASEDSLAESTADSELDSSVSSERGRQMSGATGRIRGDSVASTASSSSGAAIKFAPLPRSGRLKRANSITIGVAARSQLLQSQGTAAPQRQRAAPQHVHNSQDWYTDAPYTGRSNPEGVVDVGEEVRKGVTKAWKLLKGTSGGSTSNSVNNSPATEAPSMTFPDRPKKHFPKEGAPLPDPQTGELRMAGEAGSHNPTLPDHVPNARSETQEKGDQTPKRSSTPTAEMKELSVKAEPTQESEAAAVMEAAHLSNSQKTAKGHDPHSLEDGEHHEVFHLAEEPDGHQLDSGAATPRTGQQRRLSTGGFLRGFSIRGIQEDRRRDLLGLDDDENNADSGNDTGGHHRHGFTVRGPSGQEEEMGLEGYGHSRPLHDEAQAT